MRTFRRVGGATVILFLLAGCAAQTQTEVAIPKLPACDKMLAGVHHLTSEMNAAGRIPQLVPVPMRLCRYRWNDAQNKLTLTTDVTRPLAPSALLHELNQLKTMNEVYGPNNVQFCTMMQGNADVVILGAANGQKLTVIEVQRDGCRRVLITHSDFASYIAYLGTTSLWGQLDAIKGGA